MVHLIQREMLVASRRAGTYWLRTAAGAALLYFVWAAWRRMDPQMTLDGRGLFRSVNILITLMIWILMPMITSDAISSERRAGTLGLLLLTPIRGLEVALAKWVAHAMVAVLLLLAVIPILAIPVLLGGIQPRDVVRVGLLHGATICLALVSGLAASSLCVNANRARLLAVVFSFLSAGAFVLIYKCVIVTWSRYMAPWKRVAAVPFWQQLREQFLLSWMQLQQWQSGRGVWGRLGTSWFEIVLGVGLLTVAVVVAALGLAWVGRRMHRNLDEGSDPESRVLVGKRGRARIIQLCDSGLRWIWVPLGLVYVAERMGWIWVGGFGFLIAGSFLALVAKSASAFQDELESGILEMLLVTPVSVSRFVYEKWRELVHAAWPLILLATVIEWWGLRQAMALRPHHGVLALEAIRQAVVMLTLLVVGMAISLRRWPFHVSVPATLFLILLPRMIALSWHKTLGPASMVYNGMEIAGDIVLFGAAWVWAEWQLKTRRFRLG